MNNHIELRAINSAQYIVYNKCTIRECANNMKISRSTVHLDLKRLRDIDGMLYNKVRKVLEYNLSQRSSRGGLSKARKYGNI